MEVVKTIYVVDDDEDDRMLISEALRELAYPVNVVEVHSGMDMYELLAEDVGLEGSRMVLLDMNMPGMNGLELLKHLKHNANWRSVPVIMLSTSSNPDLIRQAYKSGVNVFAVKPVTTDQFRWMTKMVSDCFISNSVQPDFSYSFQQVRWKNLMVIEDNDDHWELMKYALEQSAQDAQITRIAVREDVMEQLHARYVTLQKLPEIIFLDLYMPSREDGLSLLEDIRRFIDVHDLPGIPIIVFSYSGDARDINAALARQANAYLIKPTDIRFFPAYLHGLCRIWANAVSFSY